MPSNSLRAAPLSQYITQRQLEKNISERGEGNSQMAAKQCSSSFTQCLLRFRTVQYYCLFLFVLFFPLKRKCAFYDFWNVYGRVGTGGKEQGVVVIYWAIGMLEHLNRSKCNPRQDVQIRLRIWGFFLQYFCQQWKFVTIYKSTVNIRLPTLWKNVSAIVFHYNFIQQMISILILLKCVLKNRFIYFLSPKLINCYLQISKLIHQSSSSDN